MKLIGAEKKDGGKFIHRYDLHYTLENGREKVYEMVTRHARPIREERDLSDLAPDAVVLVMTDASGEHILLNREFRLAVGTWVLSFPAGLIDPGESAEEAAARELWEETGLHLDKIELVLPRSFGSVGISDESNLCVLGRASGEFRPSTSAEEEIKPGWYSREEIRALLQTETFASRAQAWCWWWSREK